ncbi:hypothetical protein ACVWZZ_005866 [Bradyrhizobium sp. LM6.10]
MTSTSASIFVTPCVSGSLQPMYELGQTAAHSKSRRLPGRTLSVRQAACSIPVTARRLLGQRLAVEPLPPALTQGVPNRLHLVMRWHFDSSTRRRCLLKVLKLPGMEKVTMISEVFITCAVTGGGDAVERSPHVPVTPEQIAQSAIEATRSGAAVVHIHVRDPNTRRGSADLALYRAVVERIRESSVKSGHQSDRGGGRRPSAG